MSAYCVYCEKSFAQQRSFRRHLRESHAKEHHPPSSLPKKLLCSACSEKFQNNVEFKAHIDVAHGVKVIEETKSFESEAMFDEWKRSVENDGSVKFVVRTRKAVRGKVQGNRVTYYRCNRAGFFKPRVSDVDRKRELKSQGTRKIDSHCPAQMTVTTFSTGNVKVNFDSTHFGHDFELEHLPMPSPKKKRIAAKHANKMPLDIVLEDSDHEETVEMSELCIPDSPTETYPLLIRQTENKIERESQVLVDHLYNKPQLQLKLQEQLQNLSATFSRTILGCTTQAEVDILQQMLRTMKAELVAVRKNKYIPVKSQLKEKIDTRKRIAPQREFTPKKVKKCQPVKQSQKK